MSFESMADDGRQANPRLQFRTVPQLRDSAARGGPRSWLVRRLWPGDAYGVMAAVHKAGKTWAGVDLAVSVATGGKWLGHHQVDNTGTVLMFIGEGGEGNVLRRIDAVCEHKQVDADGLPLVVCCASPQLDDTGHLEQIDALVTERRPVLIVIDPLYLSARGADHRSLYAMAGTLARIQRVAEESRSALIVWTHFNRDRSRSGSDRITGAGPAEWGRVLGTAEVSGRRTDTTTNHTTINAVWSFIGGEIADHTFRTRTTVGAVDPDDIGSRLVYAVTVLPPAERERPADGLTLTQRRVLNVLRSEGTPVGCQRIGDLLANDGEGLPLRKRTINSVLAELADLGQVSGIEVDRRGTTVWEPKEVAQ